MARDGNIASLGELILSYRYVGCDGHCEITDIIIKYLQINPNKNKEKKTKKYKRKTASINWKYAYE